MRPAARAACNVVSTRATLEAKAVTATRPVQPAMWREFLADLRFGAGCAFDEHVGAVADHGEDALLRHSPEGGFVGGLTDKRVGIDLPITCVPDHAQRRSDGQAIGLGDRVCESDEIDLERAERELALQRDFGERDSLQ